MTPKTHGQPSVDVVPRAGHGHAQDGPETAKGAPATLVRAPSALAGLRAKTSLYGRASGRVAHVCWHMDPGTAGEPLGWTTSGGARRAARRSDGASDGARGPSGA